MHDFLSDILPTPTRVCLGAPARVQYHSAQDWSARHEGRLGERNLVGVLRRNLTYLNRFELVARDVQPRGQFGGCGGRLAGNHLQLRVDRLHQRSQRLHRHPE
uniref:(northern house mosquito) hypothetical protein n=1 Tax=Culex pipiens TaxID=7175 RepID=A0A8D8AEJ6_CULPI